MPFVDPARFNRFQQFLSRHTIAFAKAAIMGFSSKGKGAVIYHAPDNRFEGTLDALPLQYMSQSEINAAQGETRDELLQGILDRHQPPREAVFIAIYEDNTYDVSRVTLSQSPPQPPSPQQN